MEESILISIKKLLGLDTEYTPYDTDIIIFINDALSILHQRGVGSKNYRVQDASTRWSDFSDRDEIVDLAKSYVYMKVRLVFDPPANATVIKSFEESIQEHEYRLQDYAELKAFVND